MNHLAESKLTQNDIKVNMLGVSGSSGKESESDFVAEDFKSDSELKRTNMPNALNGKTFTYKQKETIMSLLNTDQIKAQWKQKVGDAKVAWGKLTEDELLQIEGQQDKLAGLIQERYAITKEEAHSQAKDFMDKHNF